MKIHERTIFNARTHIRVYNTSLYTICILYIYNEQKLYCYVYKCVCILYVVYILHISLAGDCEHTLVESTAGFGILV